MEFTTTIAIIISTVEKESGKHYQDCDTNTESQRVEGDLGANN